MDHEASAVGGQIRALARAPRGASSRHPRSSREAIRGVASPSTSGAGGDSWRPETDGRRGSRQLESHDLPRLRPPPRSSGSRWPRQATSVPPSRSSGAAYSTTTSSGASARAVTRSSDRRRSTPRLGRGRPRRCRARTFASSAVQELALTLRALDEVHVCLRESDRQREAGQSRARSEVGDRRRSLERLELERDERIGQVVVERMRSVDRRWRERIFRQQREQRPEPLGRRRRQAVARRQRADILLSGQAGPARGR